MTTTIELYEDNSGAVYLHRDGGTWALGPVTTDMIGTFAQDAQAWAAGDWEPSEDEGQSPVDSLDHLEHIATWTTAGVQVVADESGEPVAGFGGRDYIGRTLA